MLFKQNGFKNYIFLAFAIFQCFKLEAAKSPIVKSEFIFRNPSFDSCHASTLTQTKSGDILCSLFAGSEEGAKDVSIWLVRLIKEKWSFPKVVAREDLPCWNPVLYTMPSGKILLFYKAGRHPQQWSGFLKTSSDNGVSWSYPKNLPAGIIGPAKNRPLLLENGTLLCGSSIESWRRWGCWIDITSDMGDSWEKSKPINEVFQLFGIIQPTLFFSGPGKIKMLTRSHQIGYICTSESSDGGVSWTSARPTKLPNPNSSIDAINLKDGRILLVYNNSKENRYPLNVAISEDNGDTWKNKLLLENDPGEYSYPCVIQAKDGMVHISYTWNRENIKYVVLDPRCL